MPRKHLLIWTRLLGITLAILILLLVCAGFLPATASNRVAAQTSPSSTFPPLPPTWNPQEMTNLPETLTPTFTASPTLEKLITRTPGSPAMCPPVQDNVDQLSLNWEAHDVADQIITYLNKGGEIDKLKETPQKNAPPKYDIRKQDVTGDKVNDIVIVARPPWAESLLFVFVCRNGNYVTGKSSGFHDEAGNAGIVAIQDMNGNGVTDIVYFHQPIVGTHGYGTRFFMIFEWDGQGFKDLVSDSNPANQGPGFPGASTEGGLDKIQKRGDGTYELILRSLADKDSYYGGSVTGRARLDVWAWNGVGFTHLCSRAGEPAKYRIHAMMDGENEIQCGRYDLAMAAYQRAIYDGSLLPWSNVSTEFPGSTNTYIDPDEKTYVEAFARYRIILLHLIQKRSKEAKTDFDIIQLKYPEGTTGHQFAALAKAFWQAYEAQNNISAGCRSAIDYAQQRVELLAPMMQFGVTIVVPDGRTSVGEYSAVCPFK